MLTLGQGDDVARADELMRLRDQLLVEAHPARRNEPIRELTAADETCLPQPLVEPEAAQARGARRRPARTAKGEWFGLTLGGRRAPPRSRRGAKWRV